MTSESSPAASSAVDAIVQLSFAVLDVLTHSASEHELSVTQLRLLGILRDRTPSMAAIADHLGLDRSSVSGLIDRAERRGLVARQASAQDARVTIIHLTAAGLRLAEQVTSTVAERVEKLLGAVSASERARLVRVAESIAAANLQ